MVSSPLRRLSHLRSTTPLPLIAGCAFFFVASFFASTFPDVPGASIGSYLSTIAMAAPAFVALLVYLGPTRGLLVLLTLSVYGYAIETAGVVTGLPYGDFSYGDSLGGKLFGVVPYLLPVSYVPLVLAAVACVWRPGIRPVTFVLASTVLLTLMDGVLDPGAALLGFWVWPDGGLYYGVPVSNFAGWLLTGAVAAGIFYALALRGRRSHATPGMLDGAILGISFWIGISVSGGMAVPVVLGVGLISYLLHRRSVLARTGNKASHARQERSSPGVSYSN